MSGDKRGEGIASKADMIIPFASPKKDNKDDTAEPSANEPREAIPVGDQAACMLFY